ncbi:MAG: hypothetical protein KAI41_01785 [Hyphomicrobiaceae bacterium]|nr:hypothetical protein [Hyphomicrobiaceae bacterium]
MKPPRAVGHTCPAIDRVVAIVRRHAPPDDASRAAGILEDLRRDNERLRRRADYFRRLAIEAEATAAAANLTPVVTMDGQQIHFVSKLDEDGAARTRCGLVIPDALSLIGAARALQGDRDCKNCRRYLRRNP